MSTLCKGAEMKCTHPNMVVVQFGAVMLRHSPTESGWRRQVFIQGTKATFYVKCSDCGLSKHYSRTRLPKWLEARLPSTFEPS